MQISCNKNKGSNVEFYNFKGSKVKYKPIRVRKDLTYLHNDEILQFKTDADRYIEDILNWWVDFVVRQKLTNKNSAQAIKLAAQEGRLAVRTFYPKGSVSNIINSVRESIGISSTCGAHGYFNPLEALTSPSFPQSASVTCSSNFTFFGDKERLAFAQIFPNDSDLVVLDKILNTHPVELLIKSSKIKINNPENLKLLNKLFFSNLQCNQFNEIEFSNIEEKREFYLKTLKDIESSTPRPIYFSLSDLNTYYDKNRNIILPSSLAEEYTFDEVNCISKKMNKISQYETLPEPVKTRTYLAHFAALHPQSTQVNFNGQVGSWNEISTQFANVKIFPATLIFLDREFKFNKKPNYYQENYNKLTTQTEKDNFLAGYANVESMRDDGNMFSNLNEREQEQIILYSNLGSKINISQDELGVEVENSLSLQMSNKTNFNLPNLQDAEPKLTILGRGNESSVARSEKRVNSSDVNKSNVCSVS